MLLLVAFLFQNLGETSPLLSTNSATAFDPPEEPAVGSGDYPQNSILDNLSDTTSDSSTVEGFGGNDDNISIKRTLREARVVASYAVPILM